MLSPKGHPTTEEEVKSLQDELLPEHKHKIQALSLEDFVDRSLNVCPPEETSTFSNTQKDSKKYRFKVIRGKSSNFVPEINKRIA